MSCDTRCQYGKIQGNPLSKIACFYFPSRCSFPIICDSPNFKLQIQETHLGRHAHVHQKEHQREKPASSERGHDCHVLQPVLRGERPHKDEDGTAYDKEHHNPKEVERKTVLGVSPFESGVEGCDPQRLPIMV
ncbi:hypothetical protein BC936DRAFT_137761 [Jimgerdemannia flammicorona]|uniref:Uncharacterized protein n=1 Tax=Jimgerdemannia flammicorona TaxID=994334 RepID=A0A433CWR2_9FUNG|nr:hypothetical protein BC936DRAFT_137761 [Jimgerdemannia flammicorona]